MLDHEGKELSVLPSTGGVGLTLVPDVALNTVADDRKEDTVVKVAGAVLTAENLVGPLWGACGEGYASGFSFGGFGFPVGHGFFVFHFGFGVCKVFLTCHPAFDEGFEAGIFFEKVTADPGFGGTTPPRIVDETDGYIEHLVEHTAVEKSDRTEVTDGGWRAFLPGTFEVVLRFLGADLRNGDEADLGIFSGRDLEVGIPCLGD